MARARLLSVVALLLLTSPLLAAIRPPAEKEKWLTVTSDEFRIFSNASVRETRRIASDLASMREALALTTRLKVRGSVPVNVFIFRDTRAFAPYRDALFGRKNAGFAGGFFDGQDAKFVILDASTPDTGRLVYHELTHYFVANTIPNAPLWFGEGIAEFYSTFKAKKDAVEIGAPVPEHLSWLRGQALIPLRELFAIDPRSPEFNEASRQGVFYAQSWALLHYLLMADNGARRQNVAAFLTLLDGGTPTDQAFRTAFQSSYEDMERALAAYIRRPIMQYMRFEPGELRIPEVPEPQPVSRADVLTALGSLLTISDSTLADAEAFLNEAIRVNPNLPSAYAQLGAVKGRTRDSAGAIAAYEKALALGTRDPDVYLAYGGALLRLEKRSESDVKRARELFMIALELDPDSPRALAGFGATYLGTGDNPAPAIAALEKSLQLAPSQEDTAFNLLQLYADAGRRDDARRIGQTILSTSSDPNMADVVAEAVLRADLREAEKLMESGKAAEAVAVIERVQSETKSEPMKRYLESFLDRARLKAQVDRINVAIELANKGRLSAATKILDEVIPQMTDAEFKREAEKLRADFRKRLK